MGWYGGQAGARKKQFRTEVDDSLRRWRHFLPDKCVINDMTKDMKDNKDESITLYLNLPFSQQEIIESINKTQGGDSIAVAIASSWHLKDLEGVSDDVCKKIKGLFLFGNLHFSQKACKDFIRRCPNIESLVLVDDHHDDNDLESLFADKLLPNLVYLEVSCGHDGAIEAMASAPHVQKIFFHWQSPHITNDGFARLVAAGGGKELVAIVASAKKSDKMSKTLTKNFLKVVLPKFIAGEASLNNLERISVGKKVRKVDIEAQAVVAKVLHGGTATSTALAGTKRPLGDMNY